MELQRIGVGKRYSEAAIFNGVVYLAGMVPECDANDIRSQTAVSRELAKRVIPQKIDSNAQGVNTEDYEDPELVEEAQGQAVSA